MGARGDLNDESVSQEYQRGYRLILEFLYDESPFAYYRANLFKPQAPVTSSTLFMASKNLICAR